MAGYSASGHSACNLSESGFSHSGSTQSDPFESGSSEQHCFVGTSSVNQWWFLPRVSSGSYTLPNSNLMLHTYHQ